MYLSYKNKNHVQSTLFETKLSKALHLDSTCLYNTLLIQLITACIICAYFFFRNFFIWTNGKLLHEPLHTFRTHTFFICFALLNSHIIFEVIKILLPTICFMNIYASTTRIICMCPQIHIPTTFKRWYSYFPLHVPTEEKTVRHYICSSRLGLSSTVHLWCAHIS